MQATRVTRSSVLGKRAHQQDPSMQAPAVQTAANTACEQQLQTPDPSPNAKRPRTSFSSLDGEANKENVPPYVPQLVNAEAASPRTTRSLRRTTTIDAGSPPRATATPRRHASMSSIPSTPSNDVAHMAIATPPPTPPTSILPLHARARVLLRSTSNSASQQLAGRDSERAIIKNFLVTFLDENAIDVDSQQTCLYISGSPGTGKTALVNSILRSLSNDMKVVFINCMGLTNLEALWDRLLEELSVSKKTKTYKIQKSKGRDAVEAALAVLGIKCVVVLDELDYVASSSQSLSALFSLLNSNASLLRLIGIANTHTLTSASTSTLSVADSANVKTLHFAPYTPAQLLEILQARLSPLYESADGDQRTTANMKKLLPIPALTLLTKKIAAMTGDVRSLFEVLRGAIDLAVAAPGSTPASPTKSNDSLETSLPTVTPTHILAALKAYAPSSASKSVSGSSIATSTTTSNSETVAKVSSLGLQARLVLLCVLLASKRIDAGLSIPSSVSASPKKGASPATKRSSSVPALPNSSVAIDPNQLHVFYSAALTRGSGGVFDPVSRSEFGDLIGVLEGTGLVSLKGSMTSSAKSIAGARRAFGRSASFSAAGGFGGSGKGKSGVCELFLVNGIRRDEILRGLGVLASSSGEGHDVDVQEEEVRAIWEREVCRITKDLKNQGIEKEKTSDVFEGAYVR